MKDEDYLDQEFPKGKTKFRGQAMVLLALARDVGKEELQEAYNIAMIEINRLRGLLDTAKIKKDIKTARRCLNFKLIKCNNKDCRNLSCPLNKKYE